MTEAAERIGRSATSSRAFGVGAIVLAVTLALGVGWPVAVSGLVGRRRPRDGRGGLDPDLADGRRADEGERPRRGLFRALVGRPRPLVASVASLGAIGYTRRRGRATRTESTKRCSLIALAITVVVALVGDRPHRCTSVRYGDLYYSDPIGGIDFNDDGRPDYHDFAYLAFTIGMTFQVSDTNLELEGHAADGASARLPLVRLRGRDRRARRSTSVASLLQLAKVVPRGCQVGICGLQWGEVEHAAR